MSLILITLVCRSQRLYSKLLMDTLSMLLAMCGLEVQSIRLAASETLNKIVKATFLTHITRIQMTAFNEMKKVACCVHATQLLAIDYLKYLIVSVVISTDLVACEKHSFTALKQK